MYIRLIDSTLHENEYLFRLNDQQKAYIYSYYCKIHLAVLAGNYEYIIIIVNSCLAID